MPVRFPRITPIDDCILFSHDLRSNDPCLVEFAPDMTFLSPTIDLRQLRGQESAALVQSQDINRHALVSGGAIVRVRKWVVLSGRAIASLVTSEGRSRRRRHYFRLNAVPLICLRALQEFKVRMLRSWLRRNADVGPLRRPYVYFALHYQPERTTDPEAGWFSDQILALELLSSALPDEWTIYVKEHPRQVGVTPADLRQKNYRNVRYYQRLTAIRGVEMVSPWRSSAELIANCELVSSCTGSVLWEGLIQGRPGISFGPTWHSACRSTPVVTTLPSLRSALVRLVGMTREDVHADLEEFLGKARHSFVTSAFNTEQADRSSIDAHVLAENTASAFMESLVEDSV